MGGGSTKKFFGDALNVVAQVGTAGLAGYDSDSGTIKKGYLTQAADEGLGEVTGRNQGRDQMAKAEEAVRDQKIADDTTAQNEAIRKQNQDVNASRTAGSIRKAGTAVARDSAVGAQLLGSGQQDFLGL